MISALKSKIIIKLENRAIIRTKSGLVYDTTLSNKTPDYHYGHIYSIHPLDEQKYMLHIGDRVLFLRDYAETISFKSKEQNNFIPLILMSCRIDGILATCTDEEYTVLDYLSKEK